MLPSWIIEEIKKREREKLRRDDRPQIELPVEPPSSPRPSVPPPRERDGDHEEDGCGVLIDLS